MIATAPKRGGRVASKQARNRTGCIGIGFYRTTRQTPSGTAYRHYFDALLGGRKHRAFCVESLGREEAWRRAVQARAAYEQSLRDRKANSLS